MERERRVRPGAGEAEYTLTYEKKMNGKKLSETEGKEEELQAGPTAWSVMTQCVKPLRHLETSIIVPSRPNGAF